MMRTVFILLTLLCLAGTAIAQSSPNFDLHWNVLGGGGGAGSSSAYKLQGTVGQVTGSCSSTGYRLCAGYWCGVSACLQTIPLPGFANAPTDPDGDCLFEDVNGNGIMDYDDAVVLFWNIQWVQNNEPVSAFDFNGNGMLDYDDAVNLFWEI